MLHYRPIAIKIFFGFLLFTVVLADKSLMAQDGKQLFQTNCANCHNPIKQVTGPALKGVTERVPDKKLLYSWIKNNQAVLASGNKYFTDLYNQFSKTPMNAFPGLGDPEIAAILKYVETYPEPGPGTVGPVGAPAKTEESDNTLLYGILTLILAVIMFTMLQVNSSLKKLSDDKEGIPATDPVPFYRNKVYITFLTLIL
ncbi:MAG TPA: cytochrome c, partial [Puia sp.]|nr:cytochrome c [Puia sp.]